MASPPGKRARKLEQDAGEGEWNTFVRPLLTDKYQVTMAYAYWCSGRHEEHAVFELFFRKNPFKGEFTLFCGLQDAVRFVHSFKLSAEDVRWVRAQLPAGADEAFFSWLSGLDGSQIKLWAVEEGSVVYPRVPLIRVEGPLGLAQLLETTLLNLTNFSSLIATNAQRMRLAAGADKTLLEFGLRRAQGPDGAMTASRYSFVGGFDGTSNCLAGQLFGIPTKGTHAHAFVSSFRGPEDLKDTRLAGRPFWEGCLATRKRLGFEASNVAELAAFVAYAQAFPDGFLALVDTYDTLASGLPNFVVVARELRAHGHRPLGVRLDSGDLSYFSKRAKELFREHGLHECSIVASNDINEEALLSLQRQGHAIDTFGIGTNLVTCQAQPALGMVFKLVQVNGHACIKLSDDVEKTTIPGRKRVFRLLGANGQALLDLMQRDNERPPQVGQQVLCIHPFKSHLRCYVKPAQVKELLVPVFDGRPLAETPSLHALRDRVKHEMACVREDHYQLLQPTPYKVSVSSALFDFLQEMWIKEAPIKVLE